ncbi:hypothetical protein [Cupriavidus sp. YAF13]
MKCSQIEMPIGVPTFRMLVATPPFLLPFLLLEPLLWRWRQGARAA